MIKKLTEFNELRAILTQLRPLPRGSCQKIARYAGCDLRTVQYALAGKYVSPDLLNEIIDGAKVVIAWDKEKKSLMKGIKL